MPTPQLDAKVTPRGAANDPVAHQDRNIKEKRMGAVPAGREEYVVHWPEPPHVRQANNLQQTEECEIEFLAGNRERGDLLHFTGRDKYLIFQPHIDHPQHHNRIRVDLDKVRQVRLTRNVQMRPLEDLAPGETDLNFPPTEVQVYSIEYIDGTILVGDTIGFMQLPAGLFLYFGGDNLSVSRVFIPSGAVAYSQIGDPIGKKLVDENVVSADQLKAAVDKQQAMRKLVLGDYLIEQNLITREQLDAALKYQEGKPNLRVGEALIELGVLTQEQLGAALSRQRANRGRHLGQILVEMGVVDPETLKKVHAKSQQPVVNLQNFNIHREAAACLPAEAARRLGVVALAIEDGSLIIATAQALSPDATSELNLLARMRIVPVLAAADEIRAVQDASYGAAPVDADQIRFEAVEEEFHAQPVVDARVEALFEHGSSLEIADSIDMESDRVLLHAVHRLLDAATRGGTLDIHIETRGEERSTRISFRKDA